MAVVPLTALCSSPPYFLYFLPNYRVQASAPTLPPRFHVSMYDAAPWPVKTNSNGARPPAPAPLYRAFRHEWAAA
jgi:hypothetical protein